MMTTSIADLLSGHPVLAGLPADIMAEVAGCARNMAFPSGDLLLAEGGAADIWYLVRRGRVAIEVHAPGRGPNPHRDRRARSGGRLELALPSIPVALRRPGHRGCRSRRP